MTRCNAKTSDAYWSDHRCGLPKGHEKLSALDPDYNYEHRCYAVWWSDRHKGRPKKRMTGPCGFSWKEEEKHKHHPGALP